jgi:hypothetical protein
MADTKIIFNDSQTAALVVCKKASLRKLEDLPLVIRDASSPSTSVRHLIGVNIDPPHYAAENQHDKQKCLLPTKKNCEDSPIPLVLSCIQLVSAFLLSQIDYGNSLLAGLKAAQL